MKEMNGIKLLTLLTNNAKFVPSFKKNLISIGRCIDDGWRAIFRKDKMVLEKDGGMLKFDRGKDNIHYL